MTQPVAAATAPSQASGTMPDEVRIEPGTRLSNAYEALILAERRPVNPNQPVGTPTLGPDPTGSAIVGGLGLVINLLRGGTQLNEFNRAREGAIGATEQAIGQLEARSRITADPSFVEVRFQYREVNGLRFYVGSSVSETRPISQRDQPELRAPLPPGVKEYTLRIHNDPRPIDYERGMIGLDQAREELARLRR